jgi:hypothetical protein
MDVSPVLRTSPCYNANMPQPSVANMVSYAISSSLILVIHDNMIIGTNHIVLACLCRHLKIPRMQENHMPKWEKQGSKLSKKGKEKTPSDELTVPIQQASMHRRTSWYTGETLGTVGWTDGPFFSSVGWVA